ncbi:TetR/AcrR family transcriptional regulator [Amycolatopsis sp. DG1A-15b]|nr:TetR/AcrR family transcriptional regulator [Amycolatopsis sp. DG1A-15b]WIX93367.1 TetR/AcrR family transcriptional regulator [Amycolatopsis sp. DG1A-15b]
MGRPRDSGRDLAILDATLSLLTEVGYEQLSIEAVAGRSGAAKTTIYRRYPDKAALVAAAVERRSPRSPHRLPERASGKSCTPWRHGSRAASPNKTWDCSGPCSPACATTRGSPRRCGGSCGGTRPR